MLLVVVVVVVVVEVVVMVVVVVIRDWCFCGCCQGLDCTPQTNIPRLLSAHYDDKTKVGWGRKRRMWNPVLKRRVAIGWKI